MVMVKSGGMGLSFQTSGVVEAPQRVGEDGDRPHRRAFRWTVVVVVVVVVWQGSTN
jgi:hypothetical protein